MATNLRISVEQPEAHRWFCIIGAMAKSSQAVRRGGSDVLEGVRVVYDGERLRGLCGDWGVKNMWLFGSGVREDFTGESDVDVLVEFVDGSIFARGVCSDEEYGAELERMRELGDVFGRRVDIVDMDSLLRERNWLKRERILEEAVLIYGV